MILSLSLVNFRVSRFRVSHLTHETVKLCLQNTLNMSKTTRVYFGVLHSRLTNLDRSGPAFILQLFLCCRDAMLMELNS